MTAAIPAAEARLLALDVGTQSVRALVFDGHGDMLAREQVPIEPYFSRHPGWAEQEVDVYWQAMGQACAGVWQTVDPAGIQGLALTTQRATTVVVDADGAPLAPAIIWLDQRRAEECPPIRGPWGWAFKLLGLTDVIAAFQANCHANWLARHQPDIWARTHKCLLLSGYLNHQLCGEYVDSVGAQVGYIPFDYKRQRWAPGHDWKWRGVATRREQLPRLVPCGQALGGLTEAAARHLGLPAGLPLFSAGADKACEVLGAGCVTPETACLSFGTTATVNTCRENYVEATRFVPPYPAAVPGAYNNEINIYRGFWMVSWFKREFGRREVELAAERDVAPETLLDELIADIPPGSMGLTLQPYWSPGVRDPGPEAKGAIIGFGDVHERRHVYRAILEGLVYGLREGAERIEKRGKMPIRRLRVAGGGSQSDVAMQITADVFGMPAERPHVFEASGLGAAINVAVGLGVHADHARAVAAMTRAGDVFEPDARARKTYDALYKRVYKRMYDRLQPLYEDIRAITQYPPKPGSHVDADD